MTPVLHPTDPDGPLVIAALGGDGQAFGRLVERLRDRVFHFVLRRVGSPSDAEDLTQDCFLEVYAKLHTYRGHSKFSTWVMGVALNMTRNFVTRRPGAALPHGPAPTSWAT